MSYVNVLPLLQLSFYIIMPLCSTGEGFCDYDVFDSPDNRGMYNWTEQEVSNKVQRRECVYGPRIVMGEGMAERACEANLVWADYNGLTCATFDTAELRRLANVSCCFFV